MPNIEMSEQRHLCTEVAAHGTQRPSALAWVAFALTLLVAVCLSLLLLWAAHPEVTRSLTKNWPDYVLNNVGLVFVFVPVAVIVCIVLNAIASRRGGRSRRMALSAGVILAVPGLYVVITLLKGALPHTL
jgi:hypothetical protein